MLKHIVEYTDDRSTLCEGLRSIHHPRKPNSHNTVSTTSKQQIQVCKQQQHNSIVTGTQNFLTYTYAKNFETYQKS